VIFSFLNNLGYKIVDASSGLLNLLKNKFTKIIRMYYQIN